jgi:hypothetical protein
MPSQAVRSPQRKCEVSTAVIPQDGYKSPAAEPERLLGDNRCSSPTIRGAASSIGMKVAGTSPADGYTLLFALSSSFVALQRCQAANRSVNDLRKPGSNPGLLAGTRPNLTTRP